MANLLVVTSTRFTIDELHHAWTQSGHGLANGVSSITTVKNDLKVSRDISIIILILHKAIEREATCDLLQEMLC
jgi:hypothetical protein